MRIRIPKGYYYTYVFIDPRKPGKFTYEDVGVSFLFKPFYVGKGKGSRYLAGGKRDRNPYVGNIIEKLKQLGMEQDVLSILLNFTTDEPLAYENETRIIRSIGRNNIGTGPLLNMTDGGPGAANTVRSVETRSKIKNNSYWKGKKRSQETKIKMSNYQKEHAYMRGKKHTIEAKLKISIGNKGKKKNSGDKISKALMKNYIVVDPDNIIVLVDNLREYCIDRPIHYQNMIKVANRNTALHVHNGYRCFKESEFSEDLLKNDREIKHPNSIARAKSYMVTFPDGHSEEVSNMLQFCILNNLDERAMFKVLDGKRNQHKGFRATRIKHSAFKVA